MLAGFVYRGIIIIILGEGCDDDGAQRALWRRRLLGPSPASWCPPSSRRWLKENDGPSVTRRDDCRARGVVSLLASTGEVMRQAPSDEPMWW